MQNHQGWYKGDASSYFFHFLNKVYIKAEENQEKKEEEFKDANYGTFKKAVADVVCSTLENIQAKYNEYINSSYLDEVLEKGAKEASQIAKVTLKRVKDSVGLLSKK